jgi:rhodanese-related sulfurtransferase
VKRKPVVLASVVLALALAAGAFGYIFLGGPPQSQATPAEACRFESVSPLQAKSMIETRKDLLLVDVRSPDEFRRGALPGSTLIPFWDFTKGRYDLPKDKPILLVCAVGGRSLAVGQLLNAKGYREVYNLKGGLEAWVDQRVPLPSAAAR